MPDVHGRTLLFSQGYRLGGSNSLRAAASTEPGAVSSTSPDKLNNYEAGIKSQWLDRRITLNASAVPDEVDEIQLNSGTPSGNSGGAWWKRGTINGGTAEN